MDISVDMRALLATIAAQAVPVVAQRCREIADRMLPAIRDLVAQGMRASPEYESLAGGVLREEFGLGTAAGGQVEGRDAAESVIEAVQAAVRADVLPPGGDDLGGVFIGAFMDDCSDALAARWAQYASKGRTTIPWLKWLLLEGDAVILTGVEVLRDYPNRRVDRRAASRTGKVIMVGRQYSLDTVEGRYNRRVGRKPPGTWAVPAAFAGTLRSNWLVRVAEAIAPQAEAVLATEAAKAF